MNIDQEWVDANQDLIITYIDNHLPDYKGLLNDVYKLEFVFNGFNYIILLYDSHSTDHIDCESVMILTDYPYISNLSPTSFSSFFSWKRDKFTTELI